MKYQFLLIIILQLSFNLTRGQTAFKTANIIANQQGLDIRGLLVSDLDNDGDKDIICNYYLTSSSKGIGWFENLGDENYNEFNFISTNHFNNIVLVATGDLDSDGDLDILYKENSAVSYLKNNGDNTFSKRNLVNTYQYNPFLSDIDNDGDLDIIYSKSGASYFIRISWLENVDGSFYDHDNIYSNGEDDASLTEFELVDWDNDGDTDIALLTQDEEFYIIENLGNGVFNETLLEIGITGLTSFGSKKIKIADIDNDGDLDLALSEILSTTLLRLKIYLNDGLENFELSHTFNTEGEAANFLSLQDLDNDNKIDLIVKLHDERIMWFKNEDNGNFGNEQIISGNASFNDYSLNAINDLDNDSDLDIVGIANFADNIVWQENLLGENLSILNGKVFNDENANSIFDEDEDGVSGLKILANDWMAISSSTDTIA